MSVYDPQAAMMAVLRAQARVRDGRWVKGAVTHVFAELLGELRADGRLLLRIDIENRTLERAEAEARNAPALPEGITEEALAVLRMERDWLLGAWGAMGGISQAQAEAEMLVHSRKWRELAIARDRQPAVPPTTPQEDA